MANDLNPALKLDARKPPPFVRLMTICCLVTFGCYFAVFMRLPVVPLYARALGISIAEIGLINAAFFLMAGLLSFPMGLVADRYGSKPVAAAGVLVLAVAAGLLYFCTTFARLTGAYLMFGAGIAAFGPTMMALVARISPPTHLGRAYGWYTTALFGAMSLGPALGGYMAGGFGFVPVFVTITALLLADLVGLLLILPGPEEGREAASVPPAVGATLKGLLSNRTVVGCWLVTLGACFGLGMFTSFIPLHARAQGLAAGQIGLVFFAQGLANGLSRIPFGYLSDKLGRRPLLVLIGMLGFALSLAGLAAADHRAAFILWALVSGASLGLAFTSVGALIAASVDADARGVAMGGYNTCIYCGMMISSLFMGAVIEATGYAWGFYLTALINLGFSGIFILAIRTPKSRSGRMPP
ncbi:MAG: MFS transporter [Desulfobacterales bacterium]|nr:MFS transporter [Desulfobacterales bacterium]